MESLAIVAGLSALAHEGRLGIFRLLVRAGPKGMVVGEIAAEFGMPGATLSFHLNQLQHAGLVHARREGRQLIQTADFERMNSLVSYLTENCCGGMPCGPVCTPRAEGPTKKRAKRRARKDA